MISLGFDELGEHGMIVGTLENKKLSNKIASDFMDLFKEKYNSYLCRDLIKFGREVCGNYVKFAVEAVEEIIEKYKG